MKKITLLLFMALTFMLNVANAQDITVFNFDGITPVFTGASTFESVANPVPDAVNASANVGMYTHKAVWSDVAIDLTASPIDSRIYTSFQCKVYSPVAKRLLIGCRNADGKMLTEYNRDQAVTAGWNTITQNIDGKSPITRIYIGFNFFNEPVAGDVIYLDDLKFIKANVPILYTENFENLIAWDALPTVIPTTLKGKWMGGIDLQTAGDASITLDQWWGDHSRVLKLTSADAAVTIPNINVAGFDNLKLSIDCRNDGAVIAPNIEASVDGGAFSLLTTAVNTDGDWKTQLIDLPTASTISLRINPDVSNTVFFDNLDITGTVHDVSTSLSCENKDVFIVYPNPATNYILAKNAQKVTILDLNGRIVKEALNSEKVDISSLSKGAYIVKVVIANSTKIGKLIKE